MPKTEELGAEPGLKGTSWSQAFCENFPGLEVAPSAGLAPKSRV